MISIDAIFFDLDGTLIDSKRDLAQSVRYLQNLYRFPLSSEKEVGSFIGDGVVMLIQRALPQLPRGKLADAVDKFKSYYREHCLDHTYVYPGVRATLKYYRRKPMAVITNKPVRISGYLLDRLGLSPFFKVLVGGDSLPHKKPHPEPILNTLKTMRLLDPKRVVMVGDGAPDVRAGRAAGTHTCGIESNIGNHQKLINSRPDFIIKRLQELRRIFA